MKGWMVGEITEEYEGLHTYEVGDTYGHYVHMFIAIISRVYTYIETYNWALKYGQLIVCHFYLSNIV